MSRYWKPVKIVGNLDNHLKPKEISQRHHKPLKTNRSQGITFGRHRVPITILEIQWNMLKQLCKSSTTSLKPYRNIGNHWKPSRTIDLHLWAFTKPCETLENHSNTIASMWKAWKTKYGEEKIFHFWCVHCFHCFHLFQFGLYKTIYIYIYIYIYI